MYSVLLMAALSSGPTTPATFFHVSRCHGCYGCAGCFGCYGCYGGCYGCYGGCYGCYGGCYGCYGGCYGACYGAAYSFGACHGCYGSCYGCMGCAGAVVVTPAAKPPADPKKDDQKNADQARSRSNRAQLTVELPADAKLFVDDQATKASQQTSRTFSTPALDLGVDYYYILRAEMVRDGKTVSETKRVIVRAGAETKTAFSEMIDATKTVKAPTSP